MKDDNHFKSVGGALLGILGIVLLGFIIPFCIILVQENEIEIVTYLFMFYKIIKMLFPFIVIILLIGIFYRLKKNKK